MYASVLLKKAKEALEHSYSPYSKISVGAAILTKGGEIYTGCNIENSSYSATICAERTALYNAVSQGRQNFEAIAISSNISPISPCGICLQSLHEFAPNIKVIYEEKSEIKIKTLSKLLPNPFDI